MRNPTHKRALLLFEDLAVNDVIEHARGRTLTEMDGVLLSTLVMNTAEGHFNEHAMQGTAFGHRVVFGGIVTSLVVGLSSDCFGENLRRDIGYPRIAFKNPVMHGDTLYARSQILHKGRVTNEGGLVRMLVQGFNQDRQEVVEIERDFILKSADGVSSVKAASGGEGEESDLIQGWR